MEPASATSYVVSADFRDALAERYAIETEIARGAMAVVFRARDLKYNRVVAIKVLPPELSRSVGRLRFDREIDIAASLTHPHVLSLHDSGEAAGCVYYVMPFVDGESLRDRLNRQPCLPVDEAVRIASQVASALEYAHRRRIVHRDIKPGNILLQDEAALVADFGVARLIKEVSGRTLTKTGLAVGTPAYMSPEQGTGDKYLDGRSDVYSLGCVLYEMLAGTPPYTAKTPQGVIAKHLVQPIPRIRDVRPDIPPRLEEVLMRSMAKLPTDRYPSAASFRSDLKSIDFAERRRKLLALPWAWGLAGLVVATGVAVLVEVMRR